jgi:triacylglycerol lipase
MVARLQQVLAFALIASAIGWFAYGVSTQRPLLGVAGVAVILTAHALVLAAEFVILHFVQTDDVASRPNVAQLVRAWWLESTTSPLVFLWRQPFRSRVEPDLLTLPEAAHGRRGIVLVHGFFCNRGLWNPWMRRLRARGVPFTAVDLEPVFGSIDRYAVLIEAAVARVEAATGRPVVIVGHSMGGVAIRAWMAEVAAGARVHRVITIGSPHHGTWMARHGHTSNGRQMRLDNPWLAALALSEVGEGTSASAPNHARFTCFYGHCDNIVFPAATATLAGAHNVHLAGTPHVHMAYHPAVFDEALRWLG